MGRKYINRSHKISMEIMGESGSYYPNLRHTWEPTKRRVMRYKTGVPHVDEATRWKRGGGHNPRRKEMEVMSTHGRGTAHDRSQTSSPPTSKALKRTHRNLEESLKNRRRKETPESAYRRRLFSRRLQRKRNRDRG